MHYLSTLPAFLTWFPIAAGLLLAFGWAYHRITPWHELNLIREGNLAAACGYCGALLGYALVLASVMASATSRADLLIWAIIGFAVQLAALGVARLVLGPGLRGRIEAGELASGLLVGVIALAAGIINAATMLH